MIPLLYKLTS